MLYNSNKKCFLSFFKDFDQINLLNILKNVFALFCFLSQTVIICTKGVSEFIQGWYHQGELGPCPHPTLPPPHPSNFCIEKRGGGRKVKLLLYQSFQSIWNSKTFLVCQSWWPTLLFSVQWLLHSEIDFTSPVIKYLVIMI